MKTLFTLAARFRRDQRTRANPIVSFSISQNNFMRYDDLGFVIVPEPTTAALAGLSLACGAILRRRKG